MSWCPDFEFRVTQINDWLNVVDIAPRLHLRAASFCMAQGDNSDEIGFTQGMSAFLPNMTFLQPPGYVHAMVHATWQPNALNVSIAGPAAASPDRYGSSWNASFSSSAAISDDHGTTIVRLLNNHTSAIEVTIAAVYVAATCNATLLAAASLWGAAAENHPSMPHRVSPVSLSVSGCGATAATAASPKVVLPPHSYAIVVLA